jgi:Ca2+/Na+ antiporter
MKFLKNYGGIVLIFMGVLMLTVLHLVHFTFINALLIVPLLMIIAGVVFHVYRQKRQSAY